MIEKVDPAETVIDGAESQFDTAVGQPQRLWRPPVGGRYLLRQVITSVPLIASDLLVLGLSLWVCSLLATAAITVPAAALTVGVALLAYYLAGLYPGIALHPVDEIKRCTCASLAAIALIAAWTGPLLGALSLAVATVIVLACLPFFRSVVRRLVASSDRWAQPVIIFGSGKQSAALYREMSKNRHRGLRPLGFVDEIEAQWVDTDMHASWYLGTAQDAVGIAADQGVHWAVVSGSVDDSPENYQTHDFYASAMPHRLYAGGISPIGLNHTASARAIGNETVLYQCDLLALPGPRLVKRAFDIVISLLVAVVVLPVMLVISMLIKSSTPGPVIYSHERLGRDGRTFKTLKFRTMRIDAAQVLEKYLSENPELNAEWEEKHKLTVDPRVTRLGRLLRKSSLDELPQLFNVLKGEMSLVGPRPIVEKEIERYDDAYDAYCRMLPGVAGLWQVSGRNNTTYEERVDCDRFYVQNWSPWMDMYLLARTIKVVVTQDGAY